MGEVIYLHQDAWLDKRQLSQEMGVSIRWIEHRTAEGMPSRLMAGRRQYRLRQCEAWLRKNGYLQDGAA